jgi:hypothetical protein
LWSDSGLLEAGERAAREERWRHRAEQNLASDRDTGNVLSHISQRRWVRVTSTFSTCDLLDIPNIGTPRH